MRPLPIQNRNDDEYDIQGNDMDVIQEDNENDLDISIHDQIEPEILPDDIEQLAAEEANDEVNEGVELEMDRRYGPRNSTYDLRPRRPRDYSHLFTTISHNVLTQYNFKKGIEIFGQEGVAAVVSELKQLHDREVMEPMHPSDLSYVERKKALPYLMFLKKKRSGAIKGRGCADGRRQRSDITKEEASSPTVTLESVLLTSLIDAIEAREVATVDIPGAFLQAEMEESVHMKLQGKMAELLTQVDPKLYRKFIQDEHGKPVLYVKLRKAIYGTLKAALLFWTLLSDIIKEMGFTINPYDECVANKNIEGFICTIIWHVDDLKISHKYPHVVSDIISKLNLTFGNEAPLTVTRGLYHEYLGMTLDFSVKGKVSIMMNEYIKEMISKLPSNMIGLAPTPAGNHLFHVNDTDPEYLTENEAVMFHHMVAKLLFICKRVRPDIHTAVAFLSTRVKKPDYDDYKKLGRVMKYLQQTPDLRITLESKDISSIKWWVDASYAIHPDMRSHTGGVLIIGKGALYTTSTRQKLTTRSSTEGELVGIHDVLPQVIWTRYFLQEQGIPITDNIIFQDNKSAILLENNGKRSSGKRTKHINVRYFFIKDRIDHGEISVEYCPTDEMIADFFTKPLQGKPFYTFRDIILNCGTENYAPPSKEHRSVLGVRK